MPGAYSAEMKPCDNPEQMSSPEQWRSEQALGFHLLCLDGPGDRTKLQTICFEATGSVWSCLHKKTLHFADCRMLYVAMRCQIIRQ